MPSPSSSGLAMAALAAHWRQELAIARDDVRLELDAPPSVDGVSVARLRACWRGGYSPHALCFVTEDVARAWVAEYFPDLLPVPLSPSEAATLTAAWSL